MAKPSIKMALRKVVVVGLGRIGLPTAACLAEGGLDVLGVDINEGRIKDIAQGKIVPVEPGLSELVSKSIGSGNLRLATKPEGGDAFLLCLPTNLDDQNRCDLSHITSALESLAPVIRPGNLLVLESTVPVHTTRDLVVPFLKSKGVETGKILFAHAPERIISGSMLDEIRKDDRIIGGTSTEAAEAARDLYRTFVTGDVLLTDSSTSELVKLIENTYRDINIAFANEIALLCDKEGMNVWEAITLANRHPRVNIHRPGPGVGGHCIPVVPHFLVQGTKHSMTIQAAREVNDSMPRYISNMVLRAVSGVQRPTVALMGVAYKANSGDPINSPTFQVLKHLEGEEVDILVCDPLPGLPDRS
jgi:UDP-N-acetyl-D-mannosaminuronic acid dehydrogenase